jgi:hypothetical protein
VVVGISLTTSGGDEPTGISFPLGVVFVVATGMVLGADIFFHVR